MEFSQVMGIDSCVHIPMECEDTKKRNMSKRSSTTRKQLWSRSHCMLDFCFSPTLMKFNAIKNMLKFLFQQKTFIYAPTYIACWVKGEKEKIKRKKKKWASQMLI
jgi:hypothetical protein